jgi:hypothetical protein
VFETGVSGGNVGWTIGGWVTTPVGLAVGGEVGEATGSVVAVGRTAVSSESSSEADAIAKAITATVAIAAIPARTIRFMVHLNVRQGKLR